MKASHIGMLVGALASAAVATSSAKATEVNLVDYGVPKITNGDSPVRTLPVDKSKNIPGNETTLALYKKGPDQVITFSKGKEIYAVGVDYKSDNELDRMFVKNSQGTYDEIPVGQDFYMPSWLENK